MPNIEVLPNAKETTTPGWAYVLDTGADPSKQAIVPTGARKRARISYIDERAAPAATADAISSREQNRINKRLAELDRENHRDVKIEVPGKPKDVAQTGMRPGKMTLAVKKILSSQKTWVNYLDDEEARLAQLQHSGPRSQPHQQPPLVKAPAERGKRASTSAALVGKGKRASTAAPVAKALQDSDALDVNPLPVSSAEPLALKDLDVAADSQLPDDIRKLIKTDLPTMPTAEEIEALLSAPPLSYNQARAAPSTSTAPSRQFCEICGFWGRVRCMKCAQRVCGLECLRAHEETRCQKFYA